VVGIGGAAAHLVRKAHGQIVWQVDANRCINSRAGETATEACNLCTTECVVALSAVRAVNEFSKCGRCNICPAYFDITSAVDEKGLPSQKLCPRDAIARKPIGKVDPEDPANNFYEYVIDEMKCDGCGKCAMKCKEPLGLGSIVLRVRYDRCVDCNRCAISTACPKNAFIQVPVAEALKPPELERHA
jgi:ferredoxin